MTHHQREIIGSILNGQFRDELVDSPETGLFEWLTEYWKENNLDDVQTATLLRYLHRTAIATGVPEKSTGYHSLVLPLLESKELGLIAALSALLPDLLTKDATFRDLLFEYYIKTLQTASRMSRQRTGKSSRKNAKIVLNALLGFAEIQSKNFFQTISDYVMKPPFRYEVIELLVYATEKQRPKHHVITETPLFDNLLLILKTDPDVNIVAISLTALTMLLPCVVAALPPRIPELFQILHRAITWKDTRKDLWGDEDDNHSAEGTGVDIPKLWVYLTELKDNGFHIGKEDLMKNSLEYLASQRKLLLQKKKRVEGVNSPDETKEINSALEAITIAITTTESFLSTELRTSLRDVAATAQLPPPELRSPVLYYFQHLYGMFPASLFRYLTSECTADAHLAELIKPLMSDLRLAPLFLATEENEKSTARWLGKDPKDIVVDSTVQNSLHDRPTLARELSAIQRIDSSDGDANISKKFVEVQRFLDREALDSDSPLGSGFRASTEYLPALIKSKSDGKVDRSVSELHRDVAVLSREVLTLRNELLFEKYLKQQYVRRFGNMQKELSTKRVEGGEVQALQSVVADQRLIIGQLKEQYAHIKQENQDTKKKFDMWREECEVRFAKIRESYKSLQEENQMLYNDKERLEENAATLKVECDRAENKTFELESRLQNLSSKLVQQEEFKKYIHNLDQQLLMWQHQHQVNLEKIETAREAISLAALRQDTVNLLSSQLESSQESNGVLKSKLRDLEDKVAQQDKDLEASQAAIETQKRYLRGQQSISIDKLSAVEDKYNCIKQINMGLEKRILELQVKLEKFQLQTPKEERPQT
eukprot:TRINITY_DN8354_c0_g1_i2.p1 TRINITY_DN8354_c0_g1~~TRINITY_DN8354_c0_g1_i2.p1  ORF type:complete len:825 (-),score=222.42 TRINITY_DN8354_c0_g1_i2:241-2715(-)